MRRFFDAKLVRRQFRQRENYGPLEMIAIFTVTVQLNKSGDDLERKMLCVCSETDTKGNKTAHKVFLCDCKSLCH